MSAEAREWSQRIFGLWTGENSMSDNRKRAWDSFAITGLEPTLVSPATVDRWIVAGHPLHEAYDYLSPVHRADYLRGYLMFHHGGGYADIKQQTASWQPSIRRLLRSRRLIGCGYREIAGGTEWLQNNRVHGKVYVLSRSVPTFAAKLVTDAMRGFYPLMIGNCAYVFKPRTSFARLWLKYTERRLDMLLPDLRSNPAKEVRDRQGWDSGYPIPWTFILGDIFHPLSLLYAPLLARDLPMPCWEEYL
jgi:hypothetical protein